jgi:hypothetical protein
MTRAARAVGLLTMLLAIAAGAGSVAGAVPAPRSITLLHHGRTFELGAGRSVSLRLPNARRFWSTPRRGGGSGTVSIHPVNYVRDPGFVEWRLTAKAPGRLTLTSFGRCNDCTPTARRFRVTLVVRG